MQGHQFRLLSELILRRTDFFTNVQDVDLTLHLIIEAPGAQTLPSDEIAILQLSMLACFETYGSMDDSLSALRLILSDWALNIDIDDLAAVIPSLEIMLKRYTDATLREVATDVILQYADRVKARQTKPSAPALPSPEGER